MISHGKEAHSSMPQEGYNAIRQLNECMLIINQKMDEVNETYVNEELGRTIHNITVVHGGEQVNSIPNKAVIQGNIRSIPEFGNEKVIALLEEIISQFNKKSSFPLELTIDYNKIPVQADKDSALIKTIQKQFDTPLPVMGGPATTDAAEFIKAKQSFDVVIFGPGVMSVPHQVNEYVEIDNYLEMIDVYKAIIKSYLK